ncbi:MAG: hypothetical protein K9N51_11625 [Candidatus Pacebacteria bacterium]|nr:hypothetical protein [Candidatus Paceibacterota bacterium]
MRKTMTVILLAAVVMVVGGVVWYTNIVSTVSLSTPAHEIEWPSLLAHVELRPAKPLLANSDISSENAFFHIRRLGSVAEPNTSMDAESREYRAFRERGYRRGQYPALEGWLFRNAQALRDAHKAAQMKACQVPTCRSWRVPRPYLSGVQKVAEMLRFDAEKEISNGNWGRAASNYRTAVVLGCHVTRGGPLSNYVIAIDIISGICESMRRVAMDGLVPLEQTAALRSILQHAEGGLQSMEETMRFEYVTATQELNRRYADDASLARAFTFGEVSYYVDTVYAHLIAFSQSGYDPERYMSETGGVISAIHKGAHERYGIPERIANEVLPAVIPRYGYPRKQALLHVANIRGTRIVLALCAFKIMNDGDFPRRLQKLVPEYLDNVPRDPFAPHGALFLYERDQEGKHWKVYSIGPNQIDEGGATRGFQFGYRPSYTSMRDVSFSSYEFVLP